MTEEDSIVVIALVVSNLLVLELDNTGCRESGSTTLLLLWSINGQDILVTAIPAV